ncbi:MAG: clostripain-related cysteine peptidase [Candidatus Parabeggiatoa sp.]|nr:clostripain-related cysteine peptidase [Candidatus Parabeggiatoa sp.]
MRYLIFCYCFLVSPVFAIYDLVSIDITPSSEGTKFCFFLDTAEQEMYLAMTADNNPEFLFFNEKLALSPQQPDTIPPVFLGKKMRPSCFGPFSNETLQNIKLYAGVGANFEEIVTQQKYIPFFNGFPTLSKDEKAWTVMVYLVGSSLEREVGPRGGVTKGYGSKDILEMLAGTRQSNSNNVNVVISTGGSARAGWQTVKRSLIRDGHQYVLEDLGRQNMSNPQTLSDFVIWAKTQFPAQHYALILWDHGGGTQGIGQDTSQNQKAEMMSFNDLHHSYQTIRSGIDKPLDIVVYDACLMASIEVAEITATVTNAMAGSAELEPGHGIDYAHLLSHLATNPPDNGLAFGSLVKTGYIQQTKDKKTFEQSQITYSVFDLTQIASFGGTFNNFAFEFNALLEKLAFQDYERLSRGLIRAPGYPAIQTGSLRALNSDNIRIDLYSLLQTVGPDFLTLKIYAAQLLTLIDKMVVDYEGNIAALDPNAGRVSLDIGNDKSYLTVLPEAYSLLSEGLDFYNRQRQNDSYVPEGELVCPKGLICAFAQWLELAGEDILGIEAYFGQAENSTVYLIDPAFYQYRELTEELELGVNGHQACQYQLCVSETQCEDITLTQQGNQLLADIVLNDSPTVLSFCNHDDKWLACGVAQQTDGIWGRNEGLYSEDSLIPSTLHVQGNKTEQRQGKTLRVHDPVQVRLKKSCDQEKAAIWAIYYSLNQRRKIELLCDSGDCVCQPDDTDQSCKEIGFKAGVYLTQ